MNSPRRRAREVAMKALYQAEMVKSDQITSLNQVLTESVYYPVFEAIARDFLKASQAQEILSGEVENFVPDFSDTLSVFPHEPDEELQIQVRQILEKHFPGYTHNEEYAAEMTGFCKKVSEKRRKLKNVEEFARQLIDGCEANSKSIDSVLSNTAENWSLERMATIDRSILRIAACELFHFPEIPVNASINEAIELAKKYSADRSYEFVNGILDKICKENNLHKSTPTAKGSTIGNPSKKKDARIDQKTVG